MRCVRGIGLALLLAGAMLQSACGAAGDAKGRAAANGKTAGQFQQMPEDLASYEGELEFWRWVALNRNRPDVGGSLLARLAGAKEPVPRQAILNGLAIIGTEPCVNAIAAVLLCWEEQPGTRSYAAGLFLNTRSRRSLEALCLAAILDPDPWVRASACASLGVYEDPLARACLCRALKDDDPSVAGSAEWALKGGEAPIAP